ncbi:hypothetical protein EFD55_08485 [Rhizobium pisi]|uniref:Uncharacterized protein n=1 Tax=Rhizobium pisi TaxID=574561 RepID=A0A3R9C3S8_9HYPH|nr:hypothetical protein EFD55_08485 [Rhizobium pisi]TCA55970.1 hypothetical protein E0J16_15215 [Rhizobium pisi]
MHSWTRRMSRLSPMRRNRLLRARLQINSKPSQRRMKTVQITLDGTEDKKIIVPLPAGRRADL